MRWRPGRWPPRHTRRDRHRDQRQHGDPGMTDPAIQAVISKGASALIVSATDPSPLP
jgi:hypothetical protein